MLNTRDSACSCVTACAPAPTNPTVPLSGEARMRLATADAAPVRTDVMKVASTIALTWPVAVSSVNTVDNTVGKP